MGKVLMVLPIITFFANIAILLDIPIFREIVVFVFLSFVPGFAILRLFKLKEINPLETFLFSIALSIASTMFIGLLVNTLYQLIGLSQSLSTIPLTVVISAFTLAIFLVDYKRDLKDNLKENIILGGKLKAAVPVSIILLLLPVLTAWGVLYFDISVVLLSEAIIAALCIIAVVSRRLIPENLFPLLIFSISLVLVCQVLLTSNYILGYDATTEYYVFRLTQINGHWGPLDANIYSLTWQNYDMMLSVTLLPAVYSTLMRAEAGIVFKILYPFVICLLPLALYRTCQQQFGNLTGLLSTLFFIFTSAAFYGLEPLSLNRQVVGGLFFLLSIFLLVNKTLPVTKKRLLLMIFGAALAVSHYTLAYMFLGIVALVFIISRTKFRFGDTLNNASTFFLIVVTFSWYALGPGSPLISLTNTIRFTFMELVASGSPSGAVTPSYLFFTPTVLTVATWFNMLVTGAANLLLVIGILALLLRPAGTGISEHHRVLMIIAAILLLVSLVAPSFSTSINFTRFYSITLFFLAPAFVLGGLKLLSTTAKAWMNIRRPSNRRIELKIKNANIGFLLIAILLCGYFLSQVGFVNYVTNSGIHSYSTDFQRMLTSNERQIKITLYGAYIPEHDVFSAYWLLNYKPDTAAVFHDSWSSLHVLVGYGLVPGFLLHFITNATITTEGSFVYLGTLNIVNGVTVAYPSEPLNTSELSFLFDQNSLVYSNGNSAVWYVNSDN